MGFIRRVLIGKEAYAIEKTAFDILNGKEYSKLIGEIMGPISLELSPYTHKDSVKLKYDFIFLPVVDYIHGYISSGLRVRRYGEMFGEERFYDLKQTFMYSILGTSAYMRFKKSGLFDGELGTSQEFIDAEEAARRHHFGVLSQGAGWNEGLADLGSIMRTEITIENMGKAEEK